MPVADGRLSLLGRGHGGNRIGAMCRPERDCVEVELPFTVETLVA
jgi:hypothetical protein